MQLAAKGALVALLVAGAACSGSSSPIVEPPPTTPPPAQAPPEHPQFDELARHGLPADEDDTWALAMGDVDGDGDPDLVVGNRGEQNRLYLNDGDGVFIDATARLPADEDSTLAVAIGDVDGDGDLDLICGNNREQDRLYLNDGSGAFADETAWRMPPSLQSTTVLALGDLDGDGDLDLVVGNSSTTNRLCLNNGRGQFVDATAGRLPDNGAETYALALGDVDGDGDPDLVVGNSSGQNRLYLNDGRAVFTDATAALMPTDQDWTFAVALGDVDGDGDPDLVFGNSVRQQNRLYLNDGRGRFTDATSTKMPSYADDTWAMALGDVDGDGDPDLVFGNSGEQQRLYLNDGSGTFLDVTAAYVPTASDNTIAVVLADVDGDGDRDWILGNDYRPNRLWVNDGRGVFADATARSLPADRDSTWAVALGDVDGDGDLDLAFGNHGQQNRLYLNDGRGRFTDFTALGMPLDVDRTSAMALGDVDGDGDLDLVLGNDGAQNRLYLNDGRGRFADFTAMRMPSGADDTVAVALGDVDGDRDLDVVIANVSWQNRLYTNDGTGTFTDVSAAQMPAASGSVAVALGDVDGDRDLDIVFGNGGAQSWLYLNDGTGTYTDATATHMPVESDPTAAVALGDVDGDGDLDLVLGNLGEQNRLYLNNGRGEFADATAGLPTDADRTNALALGDLDGDGDLDLVFGNEFNSFYPLTGQSRLCTNDGTGVFADVTEERMPPDDDPTAAMAIGDVDGDGDLDLAFANSLRQQNRLYFNLLRQLDAPFLARAGFPYRLDAYARYGPPRAEDVVHLFLSTGTANLPLPPWGTFRLDPSRLAIVPPTVVPQPAGVASISFDVPNAASLVSVTLHAQALLVQQPAAHLTNLTSDTILR